MRMAIWGLRALSVICCCAGVSAYAQTQTLSYSLFSGDGPGGFNFSDFGAVEAVTLDAGGTTVSGPATSLYQGGAGDTTFFHDHTSAGGTFVANGGQNSVVNEANASVGAANDPVGVAVDETNGYLFFTSRADGTVLRAPLAPDGSVGAPSVFLSGLNEPTSLHLTSGSRLLVGENGTISSVDPNNAASLTALVTDVPAQTRGLEEDVANGFIYYTTDDQDDIARSPSSGGASTVIFDGDGSFQDLLLDELNSRLIVANFAVSGSFDVDGEVISYGLDRVAGTLTDGGVTLLSQADLGPTQNAYFTGLAFFVPEPSALLLSATAGLLFAARRRV